MSVHTPDSHIKSMPKTADFWTNHKAVREAVIQRIRTIQSLGIPRKEERYYIKNFLSVYDGAKNNALHYALNELPELRARLDASRVGMIEEMLDKAILSEYETRLQSKDHYLVFPETRLSECLDEDDWIATFNKNKLESLYNYWQSLTNKQGSANFLSRRYNIKIPQKAQLLQEKYWLDHVMLFPPRWKEFRDSIQKRLLGIQPKSADIIGFADNRISLASTWQLCLYGKPIQPDISQEDSIDFLKRLREDGLVFDTLDEFTMHEIEMVCTSHSRTNTPVLIPDSTVLSWCGTRQSPLVIFPWKPVTHPYIASFDFLTSGHWVVRPKILLPMKIGPAHSWTERDNTPFWEIFTAPFAFDF